MNSVPNNELLEQFTRNRSKTAFAELVQRHIGLVYSVAFRKTGKRQPTKDITQTVFIAFAHKAGSLGAETVIPGWLYYTTRLVAANFRRSETRRIPHAQEVFIQSTMEETANNQRWRKLSPMLDDALADLHANGRAARRGKGTSKTRYR